MAIAISLVIHLFLELYQFWNPNWGFM